MSKLYIVPTSFFFLAAIVSIGASIYLFTENTSLKNLFREYESQVTTFILKKDSQINALVLERDIAVKEKEIQNTSLENLLREYKSQVDALILEQDSQINAFALERDIAAKKKEIELLEIYLLQRSLANRGDNEYRVRPVYFYPSDIVPNFLHLEAINRTMAVVQAWYATHLDGATFQWDPAVAMKGTYELSWYHKSSKGDTLDRINTRKLANDVFSLYPEDKREVLLIFIEGSRTGGLGRSFLAVVGNQGLEGISEDIDISIPSSAKLWLVNKDSQRGVVAHELGHAFALEHPADKQERSRTVMWNGWAFPDIGLLESEIEILRRSLFISLKDQDETRKGEPSVKDMRTCCCCGVETREYKTVDGRVCHSDPRICAQNNRERKLAERGWLTKTP